MNGWFNLYKPKGVSSAKAVAMAKKYFKGSKIGHTGTLDLEAEGVLPLAVGEATKLASILVNSKKQYFFTIQFGAKTTTADATGEIIEKTSNFPSQEDCKLVCAKFIGTIEQIPPAYSALKINGVRAYKLARENKTFEIKKRSIIIYDLKLINYDGGNNCAAYLVDCSKGTYVRTLAEDISLYLQTLGFVIELRRTKVGIFSETNSVNIFDFDFETSGDFIRNKCLKLEDVLDDIPVLEIDEVTAKKIRFGQVCKFENSKNYDQIWLKYDNKILAIGTLYDGYFKSLRVFNYKNMENYDVDRSAAKSKID